MNVQQSRHRRLALLIGSIVFALLTASCASSGDSGGGTGGAGGGSGAAGPGGAGATGAGGRGGAGVVAGTGGAAGSDAAGAAGTAGSAGTAGTAGTAGAAGAIGAGGRGGAGGVSGAAGAAGAAGVAGTGGASGVEGKGGAGGGGGLSGAAGRGGAGGGGGSSGTGGAARAGNGGAAGTGGAARGGNGGAAGRGGGAGGGGGSTADGGGWDAPPLPSMVTVHVAGDSTAAIFPPTDATMRVGWASVLDPLFDSTVTVDDAALSGRSTKSYIDEGAWATLQAKIKTGDYLFIEFGHNDEKTDDPTRYTDPATTYRDNLKIFISGARARGGFPVLLTSICRRQFSGTTVTGTHGAYTTAVFAVGQETGTPVIDMETRTKSWLTALGPTNSIPMFAMDDNTHLSMQGAVEVAKMAVAGVRDLALPLAARALP